MDSISFNYARPATLDEALAALFRGNTMPLAGGQSLVPMLLDGSVVPETVIDIGRIEGLRGISAATRGLLVGAAVRMRELAESSLLAAFPLLAEALASVASPAIRNRATLAGNLVRANPASELPVACVALDATLMVRSAAGSREVPSGAFFLAPHRTAIVQGELVTAILFPHSPMRRSASAFLEIASNAGAPPLASVAVQIGIDISGRIGHARLVAGGITGIPARCIGAEAALLGQSPADAAASIATVTENLVPCSEVRDAAYAADVLPVLLRRAVTEATRRLTR